MGKAATSTIIEISILDAEIRRQQTCAVRLIRIDIHACFNYGAQ
jgi:hypothetical protein